MNAKKNNTGFAVDFGTDTPLTEEAIVKGATTSKVVAEAPKVIERHHAKNGAKKIWIENDVDPTKEKRKRNKHGTAINFPLFVEEYLAIEAVFEQALKDGQTESFADYAREVLKAHAKSKLGKDEYEKILSQKYNQVIVKPEKE